MPDEPITPGDPTLEKVRKWIITAAVVITWALSVYLAFRGNQPLPPPPVIPQQPAQQPAPQSLAGPVTPGAENGAAFVPATGWIPDPQAVAAVVAGMTIPDFHDTPAGRVSRGVADTFLWRAVRKTAHQGDSWYPNVNQRDVGCCVGCAYKHSVDVLQAVQIEQGGVFDFKPVSVEAIYGFSRVEVGGGGIRGDGSVGAWAYRAVKEFGNLAMEGELATFDPYRARAWGRSGVPDALEPQARTHVVKAGAKVTSAAEAEKAIAQGYPIPVCSDRGFTMRRDKDGFCRPSGSWNHCMAIIGVRGGDRPGFFILNSWGDQAHSGPVWPADAPVAGFWADRDVVDKMLAQGDSFALSDLDGFPQRNLSWLVRARPNRGDHDPLFAGLVPGGALGAGLAW